MRFLALLLLLLLAPALWAQIDLKQIGQDRVDTQNLKVEKPAFYRFVAGVVKTSKPGLGNYGQVNLPLCQFEVGGVPLENLKNEAGKHIKFLSNPSCSQLVLEKLLVGGYGYDEKTIKSYQSRRCIYTLEKGLSPMMEYLTLRYEGDYLTLRQAGKDCPFCEAQEKKRLTRIAKNREDLKDHCGANMAKVDLFLDEFARELDIAFRAKQTQPNQ